MTNRHDSRRASGVRTVVPALIGLGRARAQRSAESLARVLHTQRIAAIAAPSAGASAMPPSRSPEGPRPSAQPRAALEVAARALAAAVDACAATRERAAAE
jgi:hypothetical protein